MSHHGPDTTNETARDSAQQSPPTVPSVERYDYEQVQRAISSRNHELYRDIVTSSTQALTDAHSVLQLASQDGTTISTQIIRSAIFRVVQAGRPLYKIEHIVDFEQLPEPQTEEAVELNRLKDWLCCTRDRLRILQERLGLLGHINDHNAIRQGIRAILPDFLDAANQVQRLLQAEPEKIQN